VSRSLKERYDENSSYLVKKERIKSMTPQTSFFMFLARPPNSISKPKPSSIKHPK